MTRCPFVAAVADGRIADARAMAAAPPDPAAPAVIDWLVGEAQRQLAAGAVVADGLHTGTYVMLDGGTLDLGRVRRRVRWRRRIAAWKRLWRPADPDPDCDGMAASVTWEGLPLWPTTPTPPTRNPQETPT